MFDWTKLLRNEVLEDHVAKPIRITGEQHIEHFSEKYNIVVKHKIIIEVVKKGK